MKYGWVQDVGQGLNLYKSMVILKHGHFYGERPEACNGGIIGYIQLNMIWVCLKMQDVWIYKEHEY